MANYYVSKTTGNNSNNGTSPTTPWRDLSKVFESGSPVGANDTVYVAPGYYFENNLDVVNLGPYSIIGDVDCSVFPIDTIQPGDVILARSSFMTSSGTGAPFSIVNKTSGGLTFRNITFMNDSYSIFSSNGEAYFGIIGLDFSSLNINYPGITFRQCKFIYVGMTTSVNGIILLKFGNNFGKLNLELDSCSFLSFTTAGVAFIRIPTYLLTGSGVPDLGIKIKNCSFFSMFGDSLVISVASSSAHGSNPYFGGIEVTNCISNVKFFNAVSLGAGYIQPGSSSSPIIMKNNIQISRSDTQFAESAHFDKMNRYIISINNFRPQTTLPTSSEPFGVYTLSRSRSSISNASWPSRLFLCNERPIGVIGDKYIMHMLTPPDINTLPNDFAYSSSPSTVVEDNLSGTRSWSNINNAKVWDVNYASCTSINNSNHSFWLKFTGFGFNVPSNATITGVTVNVMCVSSSNSCVMSNSRLVLGGNISGSNIGTNVNMDATDHVANIISFGSVTYTGGLSISPSDVNSSGFGIAIQFGGTTSSNVTVYVRGIRLVVYYRIDPSPNNQPDALGNSIMPQLVETDPGVSTSLSSVGPVFNQNSGIPAVIQFSGEQSARKLILLRGRTCHTLYFPVTNSQTTISIEIRRNSAYTGLMPGMRLLSGLGVSEQTAQMTASADTWQTISIGPFTPNSSGVMRVVLFSYDTSSNGEVYFDNFSAT